MEKVTGSFENGLLFLAASAFCSATTVLLLGLGARTKPAKPTDVPLAPAPAAGLRPDA